MFNKVLTCLLPAVLACAASDVGKRPSFIVVFTDDHGYADLGIQGVVDDVRTPHIDALARGGVRFTQGYASGPQCVPSRAGLLTGRYQNRFGLERNEDRPMAAGVVTLAERLVEAGYATGMVGKWQLEPIEPPPGGVVSISEFMPWGRGFHEFVYGQMENYRATHDRQGRPLPGAPRIVDDRFRVDVKSDAAVRFVERHAGQPFFLYLAYFAPHLPLEASPEYLSRFPDAEHERKLGLAMIAAIDDGVGRIMGALRRLEIEDETLIFVIGDNGAPLEPGDWNGSLNDPLVGEKGMLTDGGIRVPYVMYWKGGLPAGVTYEHPVTVLDVAPTLTALAGLPDDPSFDGVDLMPYLRGQRTDPPHEALFWRWRGQAAVRTGRWKLVKLGSERTFLFDMTSSAAETRNVVDRHAEVAAALEARLEAWSRGLSPPGLPTRVESFERLHYQRHGLVEPDGDRRPMTQPEIYAAQEAGGN